MQDYVWDAPKRDRSPWMGDTHVSGRVIDTVFADRFLMHYTMDHLIAAAGNPVHDDVNTFPGYSAFWVMGEADYYRHLGDAAYLRSIHDRLVQLLPFMETELDDGSLFANPRKAWGFVDWSPDFNEDTPESRRAIHLEFTKAFSEGAWMLREAGDIGARRPVSEAGRRDEGCCLSVPAGRGDWDVWKSPPDQRHGHFFRRRGRTRGSSDMG